MAGLGGGFSDAGGFYHRHIGNACRVFHWEAVKTWLV